MVIGAPTKEAGKRLWVTRRTPIFYITMLDKILTPAKSFVLFKWLGSFYDLVNIQRDLYIVC